MGTEDNEVRRATLSRRAFLRATALAGGAAVEAEPGAVRRMFIWQGTRVTLIGVIVGALAAVGFTKYVQTLLYGVQRLDIAAFAGMSAVMLVVALVASYIPARRASRVDPLIALRGE